MDDEDIADAEEAKKLQTSESFAGLGSTADEVSRQNSFMDILKPSGETMGVKLLRKMGWRDGQGVGPRVRREARLDEEDDLGCGDGQELHLFAPENSQMISFIRKNDQKGLGFGGQDRLAEGSKTGVNGQTVPADTEDVNATKLIKPMKSKKKKPVARGAFGVGILNDTGSDDEDPYHVGPQVSYNRIIGGDKKKKRPENIRSAANPLLSSKPVFISKRLAATKDSAIFRRCHDGRLPLDSFILSSNPDPLSSILSQDNRYLTPTVPSDWKSSKSPVNLSTSNPPYQSPASIAKASTLSPKSRAALLGETLLPGKSVFDYLTPTARTRIASLTSNPNLPAALSEAPTITASTPKNHQSLIPPLSPTIALTALNRSTTGWLPYAEDPEKRIRYLAFLSHHAGISTTPLLPPSKTSPSDWIKELTEFAHAAQIFKPMTGMMATRFTTSTSIAQPHPTDHATTPSDEEELITRPAEKSKDPAEEAARVGMYGPLTRSTKEFFPTRLLCKRFNVRPPAHVQVDPDAAKAGGAEDGGVSVALPQKRLELVGKREMEELVRERGVRGIGEGGAAVSMRAEIVVDPERNETLEGERPGEEVFRAIFGSDSEDE